MAKIYEFEDGGFSTYGGPLQDLGEPPAKKKLKKSKRYKDVVEVYSALARADVITRETLAKEFLSASRILDSLHEEFSDFSREQIHGFVIDEVFGD